MHTLPHISVLALSFHVVSVPYDAGANRRGSSRAPEYLIPRLGLQTASNVRVNRPLAVVLDQLFTKVFDVLRTKTTVPLVVGGDHTISCGSVAASYRSCLRDNRTLGVLWCDAHADFNTMQTSPTKNLHGVPVAVLCGHTLPVLRVGNPPMDPGQFAFYGVRDVDALESERMSQHSMRVLDETRQVRDWLDTVDAVHVSFDVDCLDSGNSSLTLSVNTPVPNGPSVEDLAAVFRTVRRSGKLICVDVVELNPKCAGAEVTADAVAWLVRENLLALD